MEKCIGFLFVSQFLSKLVCGQWLLTVQLLQFKNMYNVEIREEEICCCDQDSDTCRNNLDEFSSSCNTNCDTYFFVTLSESQGFDPCPVVMLTDALYNSATTTDTSYEFHYFLNSFPNESFALEMQMRDTDGNSYREIDTFQIEITFPSDNQQQVFTGNRGIATITLSYAISSIETDVCDSTPTSLQSLAFNSLLCDEAKTATIYSVVSSETCSQSLPNQGISKTSTKIVTSIFSVITTNTTTSTILMTSTSITATTTTDTTTTTLVTTSTIVTISTSTSTFISTTVRSLTETSTVSKVVTLSATPRIVTLTTTVSVSSSPGQASGQQLTESSSDSTPLIWMSLFILFFLLTVAAVTISIVLSCMLYVKSKSKGTSQLNSALVQSNKLAAMDNPVYGPTETTNGFENMYDVTQSQDMYCTLENNLYADPHMPTDHNYSKCGPAEPTSGDMYAEPSMPNESMASPYETPQSLPHSK